MDIFDDQYDGYFFMGAAAAEPSHLLLSLAWHAFAAKTRTAPDIYSWQQMRGREWDEPKTVEVRTLERLGAYTKVAADDDRIKGRRVVETMWTGRVKRNADRSVDKRKGRAVLRGDLHKQHYDVDANQATAPVVRSSSSRSCRIWMS